MVVCVQFGDYGGGGECWIGCVMQVWRYYWYWCQFFDSCVLSLFQCQGFGECYWCEMDVVVGFELVYFLQFCFGDGYWVDEVVQVGVVFGEDYWEVVGEVD